MELQPWLLSNIVDTETSKVPSALQEFQVFERAGVRVGVIGLVEKYDLCFLIYLASFNLLESGSPRFQLGLQHLYTKI